MWRPMSRATIAGRRSDARVAWQGLRSLPWRSRRWTAAHIPTKPIAQVRAQPGQECAGAPSPILRLVAQSLQERHRIGDLCLRVEQTRASLQSLVGMDVEAVRASLRPDFTPVPGWGRPGWNRWTGRWFRARRSGRQTVPGPDRRLNPSHDFCAIACKV